jgi:hypothetical protein
VAFVTALLFLAGVAALPHGPGPGPASSSDALVRVLPGEIVTQDPRVE